MVSAYQKVEQNTFIEKLLSFSNSQSHFCLLNSNDFVLNDRLQLSEFDFLAGFDCVDELKCKSNAIQKLNTFTKKNSGKWIFGFLTYDLKNEIEKLVSENEDKMEMPLLHFFVPKTVIGFCKGKLLIHSEEYSENIIDEIESFRNPVNSKTENTLELKFRISKADYLSVIEIIKNHIQRGDVYELTYCQEFYADMAIIDPAKTYLRLNEVSPSPMSCFYKMDDKFLISSSPERFLKRKWNKLFSQPIKGTIRKGSAIEEDDRLKNQLFNDEKERAENVMIVDLVRNDLSKVATKGSVTVKELFGIYSFSNLHQMISTVSSELKKEQAFSDIIKATFPMGSMTGAPKVKAMQLIEKYESTKRGLFSGTVGYIDPDGNFDFNVIIRSMLYNKNKNYLSVMAGSAITSKSNAEAEYNECLLKAKAMFEVLKG